jgi:hypothetical protein
VLERKKERKKTGGGAKSKDGSLNRGVIEKMTLGGILATSSLRARHVLPKQLSAWDNAIHHALQYFASIFCLSGVTF